MRVVKRRFVGKNRASHGAKITGQKRNAPLFKGNQKHKNEMSMAVDDRDKNSFLAHLLGNF